MGETGVVYAGKERRNRVVALVLALVLLAGFVLALLATMTQGAQAAPVRAGAFPVHAQLVSVVPADGATVAAAPQVIELTFDDVVSQQLARVVLTRDGSPVETGPVSVDGRVLRAPVTGQAGPGAYRIAWQVVSDDGHPVSGASSFSVGSAASASPSPARAPAPAAAQPATAAGPDHLPGVLVAAVLLIAGVVLLVFEHRRRAAQDRHLIS